MNELYWLSLTIAFTALLWLPYVLNSFAVRGIVDTMGYADDLAPLSPWAVRAKKAHYNAIENLVLFGATIIAYNLVTKGDGDPTVATAAMVYFVARVAHYVVYAAKVPLLRTVTFIAAWGAQLYAVYLLIMALQAS